MLHMMYRRLLPPIVIALLGLLCLLRPLAVLAQTPEPPTAEPALLPTPTLAVPADVTATPDPAAPFIPRVHTVQDGENLTLIATH